MVVFLPLTSRLLVVVVPALVPALVSLVSTVVFAVPSNRYAVVNPAFSDLYSTNMTFSSVVSAAATIGLSDNIATATPIPTSTRIGFLFIMRFPPVVVMDMFNISDL